MNIRFLFPMGLILIVLSQVSTSGLKKKCNCGLKTGGADACGCQNVVVRPPPPQKLPISSVHEIEDSKLKLGSSGELYHYDDNLYVQPATVPKYISSPYHKLDPSYNFDKAELLYPYSPLYSKSRVPLMIPEFDVYDIENLSDYGEEENAYLYSDHLPAAPADAVSLNLAYELARRAGTAIAEEGLNFGPRTIPVNAAATKARKYVPEERLFTFDKQVVEMRYPPARYGALTQEDAALVALQEGRCEESPCGAPPNCLTYADLGYIPEYR
ncbi:uncharacterized protein LOC111872283 isoform X3 [Cryptotermes secundus]|nr:uncharacterized protein LOC111872283 isoform X3 [Cryptotermes secundus]